MALEKFAQQKRRTRSSVVTQVLEEFLAEKGAWK